MRFFIILAVFTSSVSFANDFDKIISSGGISKDHLGIYITTNQKTVYENHAKEKFNPASLSKYLTAIAILKNFAPEDRIETELRSKAKIKDGELAGSICLKGNGDPSFISEEMWVLVNNFSRTRVTKIQGPVEVDSTFFDSNYFDESRERERVDRAYDSPVSGLPFNWNSVNVYIRPQEDKAQIIADPENNYFEIVNHVKVVSGKKVDITVTKEAGSTKESEKLIVSGIIGRENDEVVKYASITYPDVWVGKSLIAFLKQRGIEVVNKKIVSGACRNDTTVLASSKGWQLFDILDGMLKFSNNFLAESLTKTLAVHAGHSPGSIAQGVEAICETLAREYGLNRKDYDFVSPSGFTNKNRISAKTMGDLLWSAYKDFSVSSYLLSALATPQTEGTLSKRMKNLEKPRMIRAKTGSLAGAVGLAGYAADTKGEVYSFVFLYNGSGKESEARALFDRMALEITKQ